MARSKPSSSKSKGWEREPIVIATSGLLSMKRRRRGISQRLPNVGNVATESDACDVPAETARTISCSDCCNRRRTSGRNLRPASESTTRLRMRSKSCIPVCASSSPICRLTALCVRLSSSAARVKLPCRAAHSNACRVTMSGTSLLRGSIPFSHQLTRFPH